MEYKKPEKRAVNAWRVNRIFFLCVCIAVLIFLLTVEIFHGKVRLIIIGFTGLLTLYKSAGLLIYPIMEYKRWKYMINDEKIEIIHGIFFIKRDIIPIVRIQNISIEQGMVYRRYKLYKLKIALASGTFEIEGLCRDVADDIAEILRKRLYYRIEQKERE